MSKMKNKITNKIVEKCGADRETIYAMYKVIHYMTDNNPSITVEDVKTNIIHIVDIFFGSTIQNKDEVADFMFCYYVWCC
jgi:hypothetical protein